MKKILTVNVDPITLNIISNQLTEHTTDFEILTSKKINEIDEIIKKLTTNFILIDLESPSPEDLKNIGLISKNHPRLPLFVMTGFETGEIESAIKSIGAIRYFEKPVDFKEIADTIYKEIESRVGGEVHGISLTSFLQMSEMEKTSCTLKIKAAEKTGMIYLLKGVLLSAEAGELKNEQAVFEILSWKNPGIEIDAAPTNRKKEIQAPLISLLMEGVRRKDEKKAAAVETRQKKGKKIPITTTAEKIKEMDALPPESELPPTDAETTVSKVEEELISSGKFTDASKALKRKRMISKTAKALITVLTLLIIGCIWQYAAAPWLAQRKFNQVVAAAEAAPLMKEKISILDNYLASGPQPRYALQAETMKRSFIGQVEAQEFDRTIETVSGLPFDNNFQEAAKAAYVNFLKQFPDSDFKDEITRRIDEIPALMDDAAYRTIYEIPKNLYSKRLQAYQSYLADYPESANAPAVREMMNSLGQDFYENIRTEQPVCDKTKDWQRCIKLCQYFLDNFQQHERMGEVQAMQRNMTARADYMKITKQVEEAGPLSEAAETIFRNYLKDYPDTPVRSTVETQLARIDQKKNQEKTWRQIVDYVKDDNNNISDRVARMKSYLNQKPPANYSDEANRIYAWLLREEGKAMQQMDQQAEIAKRKQQQEARIAEERAKIARQIQQSQSRYTIALEDTVTDNQTGLTWCLLDSSMLSDRCMDYKSAEKYVAALTTGGYDDWRLPDPSELLVIYNGTPEFPTGDASWYWTSEVFSAAWQKKVNTVIKTQAGHWEKSETDLKKCGAVRAVRP